MPTGFGSEDAQGQWRYGELDDAGALHSDLLELGQSRVSAGFAADRARLAGLEENPAIALGAGSILLAHAALSGNALTIDTRPDASNLFGSDFHSYECVVDLDTTSAATAIDVLMRAAGADYTTANHVQRRFEMNGPTPAYTNSTTGATLRAGRANGVGGGTTRFTIAGPQAAQYTKLIGQYHDAAISGQVWNHIPNTNIFTGLKIKLEGVVTGTGVVTVYGLRK